MFKSLWNGILGMFGWEKYGKKWLGKLRGGKNKSKAGIEKEIDQASDVLKGIFEYPEYPPMHLFFHGPRPNFGVFNEFHLTKKEKEAEDNFKDNEIVFMERGAASKETVEKCKNIMKTVLQEKDAKAERPVFKCK